MSKSLNARCIRECALTTADCMVERMADSAKPVSFDALNVAVAEVTGGNQHAWDAAIYKGHHPVPFMNYNSLARIVDKYRVPQPAPAVPDEKRDDDGSVTSDFDHGWNACRAAMLQAGNSPVIPDGSEDTKRLDWLDAQ